MSIAPLTDDTELVRPAWSRLHHCPVRNRWLLLVPERVLFPCPTSVEILTRIGEARTLGSLVESLAGEYSAPAEVIRADVVALLGDLVEKGYVQRH